MNPISMALALLLQAQVATVEGVVTKPGSSEPLAGARLTLIPAGSEDSAVIQGLVAISEEDGRFTIREVPPGAYKLSAASARYGTVNYGQRRPGGPGATLSVGPAQRVTNIVVSMVPTGSIAGRISDRSGEPAVRAIAQAYQYSYQDGKKTLRAVQTTTSNDLGEYRLYQLPPGPYFVSATSAASSQPARVSPDGTVMIHQGILEMVTPNPNARQVQLPRELGMAVESLNTHDSPAITRLLEDGTLQEEAWIPVFYPGTTEPGQATPLEVSADATMNGVNLTVFPSPVRRISGQILGQAGGVPRVTLVSQGSPLTFRTGTVTAESASSFRFEFRGVSPGSYALVAQVGREGFGAAPLAVEVGDRDIENIRIGLTPGTPLTGRVVLQSSSGEVTVANAFAGIVITLHQGNIELPMETFEPDPNTGAFTIPSVSPGDYQILLQSQGLSVKSARLGQTDVMNGISISGGVQDRLEIVLTRDAGTVEGNVTDFRRGPASEATVVLVPAVARRARSLYRATVADASGRFRFEGVPAGDYLLFAWDEVDNGAWQNADFLRPYESRGRVVRVLESTTQEVQISVISGP